jgi:glycerol-3-phosphate acyltransferase PlsY
LAAASAVVGHTYPLWLGFRGGKGVATGAGAFLPLAPVATAVGLLVFAVTLAATRYVSAGSVAGSLALAIAAFLTGQPPGVAWAAAGVALLVVWKHRGNLARIAGGTESRLGRPGRERQAG